MIETIFLFLGICFMGFGECYEDPDGVSQQLDELTLKIILVQTIFDYDEVMTGKYYMNNGCIQIVGENPDWVDPNADDNYGMGRASQGWFTDGKMWRTLNGTEHITTLCSPDVYDVFEQNPYWLKDRTYEKLDMTFGNVYYSGNHTKGSGFMMKCTELTTMEKGC